jgi:hypothetical protein
MPESLSERVYVGSHAEVEVPIPDGTVVTVKRGEAGKFPADFAKTLDEQDCWKRKGTTTTDAKE